MTDTGFSKKQLATILSALDDAPRSPANKGEALRAIGRSAQRFGLTTDDVLAATPGLLDGHMSPADFRVELHDLAGAPAPATEALQGATGAQDAGTARQEPQAPEPAAQATTTRRTAKGRAKAAKAKAKPAKVEPEKPAPRAGTKQARMIELLKRPRVPPSRRSPRPPAGSTIPSAVPSLAHSRRSSGSTSRPHAPARSAPNKVGAKGSSTVYRIVG